MAGMLTFNRGCGQCCGWEWLLQSESISRKVLKLLKLVSSHPALLEQVEVFADDDACHRVEFMRNRVKVAA